MIDVSNTTFYSIHWSSIILRPLASWLHTPDTSFLLLHFHGVYVGPSLYIHVREHALTISQMIGACGTETNLVETLWVIPTFPSS